MKKILFFILIAATSYQLKAQSLLWGTTSYGDAETQSGTIFTVDTNYQNPVIKYRFHRDENQPLHSKLTEASNGKLYGMTEFGAEYNDGSIFEYDPATGIYNRIYSFNDLSAVGGKPKGFLTRATNGKLYGTTTTGGANNYGHLFEFDINTKTCISLHAFDNSEAWCKKGIIIASNGKLYGMTYNGVLFSYNTVTKFYNQLYTSFTTQFANGYVESELMQATNKKFYAGSMGGGANNQGFLFEIDTLGNISKKFDFSNTDGYNMHAGLIQVPTGKLYGLTLYGGTNGNGVLFEYNIVTSTYTKKIDFDGSNNGSYPYGSLILASNNKVYGLTGSGGASGYGTLFEYNVTTATLTKKKDIYNVANGGNPKGSLMQASNGKLYGTTFSGTSTVYSGGPNHGVLFEYVISSDTWTNLHSFGKFSKGEQPHVGLTKAPNGKYYGVARVGGEYNKGTLFEYNPNNDTLTALVHFDGANNGGDPYTAKLLLANDGNLYGFTTTNGLFSQGTLFKFNYTTNTLTTITHLGSGATGGSPLGGLTQSKNGNLYGVTRSGGTNVILEYNPTNNQINYYGPYSGTNDGHSAYGELAEGDTGVFYGVNSAGGANGYGNIFKWNKADSSYTVLYTLDNNTTGYYPFCGFSKTVNNKIYGLTSTGTSAGNGALFELDLASNVVTNKYTFNSSSGTSNQSTLCEFDSGILTGISNAGGANNQGVIYTYDIASGIYTTKLNLYSSGANLGTFPYFSQLIKASCDLPSSTVTVAPDTVCAGSVVTLMASAETGTSYFFDFQGFDAVVDADGSNTATLNLWPTATSGLLEVTATNYCGTKTILSKMITVSTLSVTTTKTDATCYGCTNGTATVQSISGSNGPYTYSWSTGATTSYITGLPAGTHYVSVTSSMGCNIIDSVIVGQPQCVLNSDFTKTDVLCNGDDSGEASISVFGGTAPYLYSWSTGSSSSSITNLTAGNYSVYATDAFGCDTTLIFAITEPAKISADINLSPATCGENNGTATVTASGGTGSLNYIWSNGDNTIQADSLAASLINIKITDSNGCMITKYTTINALGGPVITPTIINPVLCYGSKTGSAAIQVIGNNVNSITWSNGSSGLFANQLAAGGYDIAAADTSGCVTYYHIDISQPNPILSDFTIIDATCGENNGSVISSVTGGTKPYTYLWSNSTNDTLINNIAAGSFWLNIQDDNGCSKTFFNQINNAGSAVIVLDSLVKPSCGTGLGTIDVSVNGGNPPYNYSWSNGDLSEDLYGIDAGGYIITVTDNSNCVSVLPVNLNYQTLDAPEFCMITADPGSTNNKLVWDKTIYPSNSKGFNLYKEFNVANSYEFETFVPYDSLSEYVDSMSNYLARAYRYKLSIVDDCNVESPLSTHHKSFYLAVYPGFTANVNHLLWDDYEGYAYNTFYINRYTDVEGWVILDSLPATDHNYTDITAPSTGILAYYISVKRPSECSATRAKNYNASRSNTASFRGMAPTTIKENKRVDEPNGISVYPNPSNGICTLRGAVNMELIIYNTLGVVIQKKTVINKDEEINLTEYSNGIYIFKIFSENENYIFKVISDR